MTAVWKAWCIVAVLVMGGRPSVAQSESPQSERAAQLRASLNELPIPDLEREEPAVREQLEHARAVLDAMVADPDTPQDLLGETFGQLGRLYLLYDQNYVGPQTLRNATLLAPEDPRWHYFLAVQLFFDGDTEEAEVELRRVLELLPDDGPALIRLADLLVDRGDVERGDLAEAEQHYDRALELRPDSAAALAGLGRIAATRGEHVEAVELLTKALELQPGADALYHPLGMSYRSLGERGKAVEALGKNKHGRVAFFDPLMEGLAESNLSTEARFQAGSDAMRRGEMEEAAEHYRMYLDLRPEDEVGWHNLGVALLATDHFDEGVAMLRKSVQLAPDYRGGHFSLASALAEDGRFEEALAHYQRAHEIDPEEPVIHADWATLLARQGRIDEALAELEALLEANPSEPYAQLKYGTVLALSGRTEEAEAQLEELSESAAQSDWGRSEAHYHLGVIELNRGEPAAAQEHFEAALELDPSSLEANRSLATLLAREGQFEEAADYFDRALESGPWDARLHSSRGVALLLGENYPRARIALQESLTIQPGNMEVAHLLARLLATCPDDRVRDGNEAVALASQLMEARLSIDHAETMAMALAEVGSFDDAIELQGRVLVQIAARSGEGSGEYGAAQARLEGYRASKPVRAPWLDQ